MDITISMQPSLEEFAAHCSSTRDKEILLELINNQLEPKRAPDVLDFIGRSYSLLEHNAKFQNSIKAFFRDVIWRRFQKVVWSDKGTVGIDVPIESDHVRTFLKVAKLPAVSAKYVDNIVAFLSAQAKAL